MSDLVKEIKQKFTAPSGAYELKSLDEANRAWVINSTPFYGVAIEYDGPDFYEEFSEAALRSDEVIIGMGQKKRILYLYSCDINMREAFAAVCSDFADPGEAGQKRKSIKEFPLEWWRQWSELLGNAKTDKTAYSVAGELMTLLKLLESGKKPVWAAVEKSSHDIETDEASYEVKSTVRKEASRIRISSQFQLDAGQPLYLIFNRMEKSIEGESIDSLMKQIRKFDEGNYVRYENYLSAIGFEKGSHYRKTRYKCIEQRKYTVDEKFPKITAESFADGVFPTGIIHIEYDVDLDSIAFENWNI